MHLRSSLYAHVQNKQTKKVNMLVADGQYKDDIAKQMTLNNDKLMSQLQSVQRQLADSQAKQMRQEELVQSLREQMARGREQEENLQMQVQQKQHMIIQEQ